MANPVHLLNRAYQIARDDGLPELLAAILRFRQSNLHRGKIKRRLVLECDGTSVCFDVSNSVSERWFYPRYLGGELHEPAFTRRLLTVLESDSVFYDIGANVGYFTLFASEKCVDGEVHSFELDDKFVDAIRSSLRRNGTTARITQKAVSDRDSEVTYSDDMVPRIFDDGEGKSVETISLDEYTQHHSPPTVMKVDVEGFEYNVLNGAHNLLKQGNPEVLFVEVHPEMLNEYGHDKHDILSLLHRYGYECRVFSDHRGESTDVSELSPEDINGNTMLECRI